MEGARVLKPSHGAELLANLKQTDVRAVAILSEPLHFVVSLSEQLRLTQKAEN